MKLSVTIDVPLLERLDIDGARVVGKVGTRAATLMRQRVRRGQDIDGNRMPGPLDDPKRRALRNSGELVKSIKRGRVNRKRQHVTVAPRGFRSDDGRPHFVAMADFQKSRGVQVMGLSEQQTATVTREVAEKEIAKQLAKSKQRGRGGLISKVRRLR